MRLLIDLQACQNGSRARGIGRYAQSLARALARTAGEHRVFVLLSDAFPETIGPLHQALAPWIPADRFITLSVPSPVDHLRPENQWRRRAAEILREQLIVELAPEAVLLSTVVEGALDDTVVSLGWAPGSPVTGAVLYDLIPLSDPDHYLTTDAARDWYHDKLGTLRRADLLLAISQSAKREAESLLGADPGHVHNISSAADEGLVALRTDPDKVQDCQRRLGIQRPYLMHTGVVEPRKNFLGLITAFARLPRELRQRHQLVLVGKVSPQDKSMLEFRARDAGLAGDDLIVAGHQSDEDLAALYAGCHLFVFPSLHEGFGLPALEAMHFGAATIGSRTSSVPEVIGRDDATFDPTDPEDIARLITRCLRDDGFHAGLKRHARVRAESFSWDRTAQATWKAFEAALQERARSAVVDECQHGDIALQHIAGRPGELQPDDTDLTQVVACLARNRSQAERIRGGADWDGPLRWRLEGPFDSSYSLALVNRETARAMSALGHDVALHSTEGPGDFTANPDFLAANPDIAALHAREPGLPADCADVTSRNLYPPRVGDMSSALRLLHPYAWEESGFPVEWAESFNQHLSGVTVLSRHVERVLVNAGLRVGITPAGTGVDHWDRVVATPGLRWPGRGFRFLHVSSCFPRKGADAMLESYGRAFSDADDVSLLIKTFANPHNEIHQQLRRLRATNPRFPDVVIIEEDLPDVVLRSLYEHCQVLVAPSRAEGFGLPLAEAMLSGLPIITTAWSGQTDFCNDDNSWLVDFSFARARSHFDLHDSVWAEPDRESLAQAMRQARVSSASERASMAARGQRVLRDHFLWAHVAARGVLAARRWSGPVRPAPRVGWVTTWNTRCGIASYSRYLIEAAGDSVCVLAPIQAGLVRADEDFCIRCWRSDKISNDFAALSEAIDAQRLEVLIVQFNYGFFNLHDLAIFLDEQVDAGRTVIVTLHSTADEPALQQDPNWQIQTLAPALARCDRLLVHTVDDMNRLRALRVIDNLVLFPHPLWTLPPSAPMRDRVDAIPLVASFGYCLPHKGLPELVEAVHLLKLAGRPVRLRLLNAEYPDVVSTRMVADIQQRIQVLEVGELVEFRHDYLADDVAAALLREADLIVFAYQDTRESASGAVRHGIATGRPIAVTPLPIFDELSASTFRLPGTRAQDLADGIEATLQSIEDSSDDARRVAEQAERWRTAHAVGPMARRLSNIAYALSARRPDGSMLLPGSSRMLRTQVGMVHGRFLRSTGSAGYLMFGPYAMLPRGTHRVDIKGRATVAKGSSLRIEVMCDRARHEIARFELADGSRDRHLLASLVFHLDRAIMDLEVRIAVGAQDEVTIEQMSLRPERHGAASDPEPSSAVRPSGIRSMASV